ncbi:hypothetical protein AB0K87_13145 [Streptomyces sp. NPDC053705]|uniref:hypothetical protein n=1 Tax=Streptomyces sp. NPDC053705 TaxID=3156668 RepID=UPI003440CE29
MSTNDQPDPDNLADHMRPRDIETLLERARLAPADRPALADHNRRALARQLDQPDDPKTRLLADILDVFNKHEHETAAARAAAGDPNPYDLDPFEPVHDLANYYAKHRNDPAKIAEFCDQLADELALEDIRALRLAGEAVVAATPRAIRAARRQGVKPPRIADLLGLTPSRVYQVLRELALEDADDNQPDADK